MKVLVTGGAGFIGGNLIGGLLDRDFEVWCIDNYSRGNRRNLRDFADNPKLHILRCDIRYEAELIPLFERGMDVVFHEAAMKNTLCELSPLEAFDINVLCTKRLLDLSAEFGVRRFIFASTASVYGRPVRNILSEKHPTNPMSVYGVSKLAAEKFVQIAYERDGLATTILRYFHVYGPRCDASDKTGDVIPIFIRKLASDEPPDIHGDGLQERSYTYVEDVVKANLLALENEKAVGEIYNIASGLKISVRHMVEALRWEMDKLDITPTFSDWRKMPEPRRITNVSNGKIGNQLGFWSWTPFDVGLRKTISWYKGDSGRWALNR